MQLPGDVTHLECEAGTTERELFALRWSDVDFENLESNVSRSIGHQVVGNCKNEASAKAVPMDRYMAEDWLRWRRQSDYASDDDYVFASETMQSKQLLLEKRKIDLDHWDAERQHICQSSATCKRGNEWFSREWFPLEDYQDAVN